MLLETKGVVHLAPLFGSTSMVNSIVLAAIVVMAPLSNLFVLIVMVRLYRLSSLVRPTIAIGAIFARHQPAPTCIPRPARSILTAKHKRKQPKAPATVEQFFRTLMLALS
jgi:hypothetical protein